MGGATNDDIMLAIGGVNEQLCELNSKVAAHTERLDAGKHTIDRLATEVFFGDGATEPLMTRTAKIEQTLRQHDRIMLGGVAAAVSAVGAWIRGHVGS